MAEIEIRPAIATDIEILERFDHSCETTHVWQINNQISKERVYFDLREVRLPRVLNLDYPRKIGSLKDNWTAHSLFLVARIDGNLAGYLILEGQPELKAARISDLVVDAPFRRQGIASALILASGEWLKKIGVNRMTLEVPAKNHAMIELMHKLRFVFSGLADDYYANHDMAFFFFEELN
jgi:ribosomal protein S18 acetylase RimI-like enzyme